MMVVADLNLDLAVFKLKMAGIAEEGALHLVM